MLKIYLLSCAIIFLVVAIAHLARLVNGWPVKISEWDIPVWVSVAGLVIPGIMSICGFALAA
jgi:hypothetical protein